MREFVTAVDAATEDRDEGTPMRIDGTELRYYKPTDGQLAVFMAANGRHARGEDRVAAAIDFFVNVFDKDDQTYVVNRLLDRDDPFGLEQVEEILVAMIEEWTGRPFQSLSGSTPLPKNGGPKSTRRTRKSTSSASPTTAS